MEVLKSNFEESYPEIKKAILEADFIAIDTEFTGLTTSGTQFHNADDIQTRYSKINKLWIRTPLFNLVYARLKRPIKDI
ncbi:unnamed protein product [Cunninghamella echinulata]